MTWQPLLLAIALAGQCGAASVEASLGAFVRQAMSSGEPNRVPGPIAALIGVEPDAPVHQFWIPKEQTSDGMTHLFKVVVELSTSTPRRPIRPTGLVLSTSRVIENRAEDYVYRADLKGIIGRAVQIIGTFDGTGKAIRGSGTTKELDVAQPDVKKRFQHELDLWLKRRYLKNEWRSAEFSGGVLKKKGKAP